MRKRNIFDLILCVCRKETKSLPVLENQSLEKLKLEKKCEWAAFKVCIRMHFFFVIAIVDRAADSKEHMATEEERARKTWAYYTVNRTKEMDLLSGVFSIHTGVFITMRRHHIHVAVFPSTTIALYVVVCRSSFSVASTGFRPSQKYFFPFIRLTCTTIETDTFWLWLCREHRLHSSRLEFFVRIKWWNSLNWRLEKRYIASL